MQNDADFAADLAKALALDILAVYQHLTRQVSVRDIRDNAAYDIQKRAFPFARMSRNKVDFTVIQRDIYVFEYSRFPVIGKVYIFEFYRVHNTTVQTAPAASPKRNSTSDRQTISFLYTV